MSDGQSKTLLLAFFNRIKRLREERKQITEDIAGVRKEAKDAGFDARKIEEVVRWSEDVDKHGREKVDEAEAIFDLYRQVCDGGAVPFDDMMDTARDRALLKMFAGADQVEPKINTRTKRMQEALAMARAAKQARER